MVTCNRWFVCDVWSKYRLVLLTIILTSAFCGNTAVAADEAPPNILVFLVDDLGWQDVSVPFANEVTPWNRHFRTPHLEALAARGVKFTQAYACAVCSPSRTSLMTGLNAARHGVTNWTLFADRETSASTPCLLPPEAWRREGLQPSPTTLAALLRDRLGYRTIHVGKAHWGAYDTAGSDPKKLGFDVNIAGHAAGGPGHYHGSENFGNHPDGSHQRPWGIPGLEKYHGTETHLTDALTEEARLAMSAAVADQKPFFLYMAHYAVHAPIQPHTRFLPHYTDQTYPGTEIPIPEAEAKYASMVEGMDASLGTLLAEIKRLGVARNTIVVFLSDNGGLSRHARGVTPLGTGRDTHCWPLREGKGSAYEGGTRIPFVVAWAEPDANDDRQQTWLPITEASVSAQPIMIEDLFATVLTWAGGREILDDIGPIDGIDISPALVGDPIVPEDEPRTLVFHYPHQWTGAVEGGYQPHSSVRRGDWKAIYFYESQRWELYNLADDVGEHHDLAEAYPERLFELSEALQNYLVSAKAPWPIDRRRGVPSTLLTPGEIRFPEDAWEWGTPAEAGWTDEQMQEVAAYLGGRGFVTYDGRAIFQWGDANRPADVASAVKPLLTHLTIEAVEQGKLSSFEQPAVNFVPDLATINRELQFKDRLITFRHFANQTSCYGVAELPGQAFDYNDFQMALFFDTLVEKVHGVPVSDVDSKLLGPYLTTPLQCEDKPSLLAFGDGDRPGRLRISPRDFCRFGLLYMHDGYWNGAALIPPQFARMVTRSPLPASLPRTRAVEAEMLPDQRSLGSRHIPDDQTDHFGSYSWLWWVNGKRAGGDRFWPDAPVETMTCLGHEHGMRGMMIVPAWKLVMSWNDTQLDRKPWENPQVDPHPLNEVFRILAKTSRANQNGDADAAKD